jgi:hypothetical protein
MIFKTKTTTYYAGHWTQLLRNTNKGKKMVGPFVVRIKNVFLGEGGVRKIICIFLPTKKYTVRK